MSGLINAQSAIQEAYRLALPEIRARSIAMVGPSLADEIVALPDDLREGILASLTPAEYHSLLIEWGFWARPKQRKPAGVTWRWWLCQAGRGSGKSRTGAEFVRERVEAGARSIGIIGPTYRDVAHFMLGGHKGVRRNGSGLLDVFPENHKPRWYKTDGIVEFHTGAVGYVHTAEEPEFRGPNLDTAWCDEMCKWRFLEELFDNIEFALRVDDDIEPQGIITTTPKNFSILKRLIADPYVFTTLGSTDENRSNLAASYIRTIDRRFRGSKIERQERDGEIVDDNDGALFFLRHIEAARVASAPPLKAIAVAADPAISTTRRADLTGIVVVGIGFDGELYVLGEYSGLDFDRQEYGPGKYLRIKGGEPRKHAPDEWGELLVRALRHFQSAYPMARVSIVGERNRGGDLVKANVAAALYRLEGAGARLDPPGRPKLYEDVQATKGKDIRAEPISTFYAQLRVHHVGVLSALEAEATEWDPTVTPLSPNRVDALVWGGWALGVQESEPDASEGFRGLAAANERLARGKPREIDAESSERTI